MNPYWIYPDKPGPANGERKWRLAKLVPVPGESIYYIHTIYRSEFQIIGYGNNKNTQWARCSSYDVRLGQKPDTLVNFKTAQNSWSIEAHQTRNTVS